MVEAPVVALDSKLHVTNLKEQLKQQFPDVDCTIVTDPVIIEEIIGKPPSADKVLIKVMIPEGIGPDIFKTWAESLNKP